MEVKNNFICNCNSYIDELEKSEYEQHGFSFYMPKPVGKKAFESLLQSVGM